VLAHQNAPHVLAQERVRHCIGHVELAAVQHEVGRHTRVHRSILAAVYHHAVPRQELAEVAVVVEHCGSE